MAESFLKEQLERIKKMTERMSAVQGESERLADDVECDTVCDTVCDEYGR